MGKDAEVAWLSGRINTKNKKREAKVEDKTSIEENTRMLIFIVC